MSVPSFFGRSRPRLPRRHTAYPASRPALGPFTQLVAGGSIVAGALTLHSMVNWQMIRRHAHLPFDRDARPSVTALIDSTALSDYPAGTITSLLAQRGIDLDIIVGQPRGPGATTLEEGTAADPRVRVLRYPEGSERDQATRRAALASEASGEVLMFCDPTLVFEADSLVAFLDMLVNDNLDVLSPYPRQVLHDFWGAVLQPLRLWAWATFVPMGLAEHSNTDALTVGAGHLLVCRADTYTSCGGYDRVGEGSDGGALARQFSSAGLSAAVADGSRYVTRHDKAGWSESAAVTRAALRRLFSTRKRAAAGMGVFTLAYLLPPVAAVSGARRGDHRLFWWGSGGLLSALGGRAFVAWRSRGTVQDVLAHFVAVPTILWLGLTAWVHPRQDGDDVTT